MKVIAKITKAVLAAGVVAVALLRPPKVRATAEPESTGAHNPCATDQTKHNPTAQYQTQTYSTREPLLSIANIDVRGAIPDASASINTPKMTKGTAQDSEAVSRDTLAYGPKPTRRAPKPKPNRWPARVALSLTIVMGFIVATAGASYAYITLATNAEKNPVASKQIQISLIENDEEVTTPTRTMPLGINTKKVEVYNPPGSGDAVVRVTFSPQLVSSDSSDDQTLYEFNKAGVITAPINNQTVMGTTTLYFADDWNNASNGWLYKDGYFYYNRVLEAGNKTPPLLTGITTSLASVNIEIVVSVEGIQAHPNQAVEVWGVSIS